MEVRIRNTGGVEVVVEVQVGGRANEGQVGIVTGLVVLVTWGKCYKTFYHCNSSIDHHSMVIPSLCDKSAASLCSHGSWIRFGTFLVNDHKFASKSPNHWSWWKDRRSFGTLRILEFYTYLTKFKKNEILLIKISHQFLETTKLLTGWNRGS